MIIKNWFLRNIINSYRRKGKRDFENFKYEEKKNREHERLIKALEDGNENILKELKEINNVQKKKVLKHLLLLLYFCF